MNFDRIDSILEEYLDRGYYPSAVCQIFDREKTLYHKSFGDAAPGTWYDLASVSKIVCTTCFCGPWRRGGWRRRTWRWNICRGRPWGL